MRRSTLFLGTVLSITVLAVLPPSLFSQEAPASRETSFNRSWAERAFADTPTAAAPANRIVIIHESAPGDTKKDLSSGGSRMQLGEKPYTSGLGVSPQSVIRVELAKPASRFTADIGVDRPYASANSSVRFSVEVGGKKVFASDFMTSSAGPRTIDVPLEGARTFDLVVEGAHENKGFAPADWADAKVLLQDGERLGIDDLADQWDVESDLPFSFMLAGQSSREFLGQWKRDVHVKQLDNNRVERTVSLQDPKSGLEVRAVAIIYTDTPGVDWTLYLSNHGTADTAVIEKLNAMDVTVDPGVGTTPLLQRLQGSDALANDWQPYDDALKPGQKIEFGPTRGRSSEGACPFFNLRYGGGGVITAVGWSGDWSAATEWQKDGKLHLQAGLRNLHLKLHPGESIRSPRIMQLYWFGADQFHGYNLFRDTMFSHIMPRIDGAVVVPPIVHLSTSFYEFNESTEADVLSHLGIDQGLRI